MESLLWALDLCAVVYLCLWALRTDKARAKAAEQAAAEAQRNAAAGQAAPLRKESGHA